MTDDKIVLDECFALQAILDEEIASNHHVDYESTYTRRVLALLVELGEFANETRCFKYWSYKGPSAKDVILDEYADGLHFFLSLGIDIGTNKMIYHLTKHEDDLTKQFHQVYHYIDVFYKKQDEKSYIRAFQSFFNLLPLLGYRWASLKDAYYKKLKVNYDRQNNNY